MGMIVRSLFVALLLVSVVIPPARAAIQEINVIGMGVDASPNKAKAIALDYARKRAVYLLMTKIKIDNADARAAALTPAQLGRIIRGADIKQLKREGDVTYADVSVSIVDSILQQELALDKAGELSDAAAMRGIMVLPVYVVGDRPYVWEKENRVRGLMSDEVLRSAHGSVVVPTGDFEDLRLVDYRNVLTVKGSDLKPMFERYGVAEIIITVVTKENPGSEEPMVILMRRLTTDGARVEQITLPAAAATESPDARLNQAVSAIAMAATEISASTSHQQQEKLSMATQVPITFRFGNMREIALMQTAIRSTDGVMLLSIPTIELSKMSGVLYLSADKDVVMKALTKKGLIVKDNNNGWQVSLR